jgi:hypothetical protein
LYECTPLAREAEDSGMPFDGTGFVYNESLQKLDAVMDLLGSADRWCKGALRSHDGRYCIRGAIRAVSGTELLEPVILQAIGQVAGRRLPPHRSLQRSSQYGPRPGACRSEPGAPQSRSRSRVRSSKPAESAGGVAAGALARRVAWLGYG